MRHSADDRGYAQCHSVSIFASPPSEMPTSAVTGVWTFVADTILLTQRNSNAVIYVQF